MRLCKYREFFFKVISEVESIFYMNEIKMMKYDIRI